MFLGTGFIDMDWFEINITIEDQFIQEIVNVFLFELGVTGTVTEDKNDHWLIKGYLPSNITLKQINKRIQIFLDKISFIFPSIKKPKYSIKRQTFKDNNWVNSWRKYFRPIHISKNLTIIPPWESTTSTNTTHTIVIEPGPAFGTGYHPTTQLCLKAIEYLSPIDLSWNMLDIGTGSGILSIYAALLGAKDILAIDIDPIALKWAKYNINLNNVSDKILLSSNPIQEISGNFYLITANLLFDEMIHIIPYIPSILNKWFIISGILQNQFQEIQKILNQYNFLIRYINKKEDWISIICINKKSQ